MLRLQISNKKPVVIAPSYQYTNKPSTIYTADNNALFNEATRRDGIVKKLYQECPFFVGDSVRPKDPDRFTKYGVGKITHICTKYTDLGKDYEWPQTDNPLIVTVMSNDGEMYFCTTNYLCKP